HEAARGFISLWGRTIEAGVLEDPWARVPADAWQLTGAPAGAGERAETVIGFERGVPVSVDGREAGVVEVVAHLNRVGGSLGFGRVDMIEDRRVGIKSREVYEVPGALALLAAHRDLEDLTLERDLARDKARLEGRWAELVYDGLWFSPLKDALDAFMASAQQAVTGEVRLEFGPWSCQATGRRGPRSLYRPELATYGAVDGFDHEAARGFISLWGLSSRVWARAERERPSA
ncbi:MAG TPA: argininosuccinate synthase, partial [Actinomycetes bacterium]|nr:argininosuccinate synthase [Actinomycetes bacterium]